MLTITLLWGVLGVILAIFEHFTLTSHLSNGPNDSYSFADILTFHVVAGLSGGFCGSLVLIFVNERFRTEPYYKALIVIVFFFVVITGSITVITSAIPAMLEASLLSQTGYDLFLVKLLTTFHLKNGLFWAIVVALTFFFLQMSNKFGPGNLLKVITGRYNVPKSEDRIFMFLDLKSSTSIAEELGSRRYHQFLKEVFADVTNAILDSEGDIYQYVGDEIVISWPMNEDRSRFLDCFFDIRSKLSELEDRYDREYGFTPVFKAGVHCGSVIAGEIGIIKRDITYSGDILNTTARIQGQCNLLGSRFLISKPVYDLIEDPRNWTFDPKGSIELRGKKEELELLAVLEP